MIENRELTEQEFNWLIREAPDTETRNLKRILGDNAYAYFKNNVKVCSGLLSNGRPIYFAALSNNNRLWTIVNSNVREQFSLYKNCKRAVYTWFKIFGKITTTMEKINKKNIQWVKKMGFKTIYEDEKIISFALNGGKYV